MFEGQPKALFALSLANTGERFGYYTMIAVFALFLRENFGFESGDAGMIYSSFLGLVYFLPLIGGILADKFGFGKMVTAGILVMFTGYLLLSIPLGADTIAVVVMAAALICISFGTGLFKGNLQVMVGNLYDTPELAPKRDSAFSIFYMAINIGALFAPTAAIRVHDWAMDSLGFSSNDAYHFSFAVACLSLILSIAIYYACRPWYKHVEGGKRKSAIVNTDEQLTPAETKARIIALCLVFAVVIFFWMAFHQNGLALTYFAKEFVASESTGIMSLTFNVFNLVCVVFIVYALFQLFSSKTAKAKAICVAIIVAALGVIVYNYVNMDGPVAVSAPIFQHFNPFYVVALTPVSMAIFSALSKKGKEPTAPRKIAFGMIIAGAGFIVMAIGSIGLLTPEAQKVALEAGGADCTFASPNWLIGTYFVLTFAELLLSPMGISFVSKVAPPKYKGMMMGGWFVSTAVGNLLVAVGGYLWGDIYLPYVWIVFVALCLISAVFMFSIMKRLEAVAR